MEGLAVIFWVEIALITGAVSSLLPLWIITIIVERKREVSLDACYAT